MGINPEKVSTIYNFIEKPQEKNRILKKIEERKQDPSLHLLYMAGINSLKGFWGMLEAIKVVKKPFQLDVCGLPTQKEEAEKLDTIGHLDPRIKYHGFVTGNEKDEYFMNADALILPSNIEGLPVSLIEAINYGCFIISTDVGGIKEVFQNCGIIMKPGSVEEISNAINWVAENKENLYEKERENLNYSYEFTLERYVQNVCDFMNSISAHRM
jgi:glycosyltransferase involved in cell wall biosynthesis